MSLQRLFSAAFYDYLLYYECASTDYLPSARNNKISIIKNSPGTLLNHIDWNVRGTTVVGDSGGLTKCGVTHTTWGDFWKKAGESKYKLTCGSNVNNMKRFDWLCFIDWYSSGAINAANDACRCILFQNKWGSGGGGDLETLLQKLKNKADNKTYNYKTSGGIYEKLADATFAFKNPMDAFQIIRDHRAEFLFKSSGPSSKNKKFRNGWLRRCIGSFQDDGLYIADANELFNLSYETSIEDRKKICSKLKGTGNYIKIASWDKMPTTPDQFSDDINIENNISGNGYTAFASHFSNSIRNSNLRNSKPTEIKEGTLLGPLFKQK